MIKVNRTVLHDAVPTVQEFKVGGVVRTKNDLFQDGNGLWEWLGVYPKYVPENSSVSSTGGTGASSWNLVSSSINLNKPDSANLVNGGVWFAETIQSVVQAIPFKAKYVRIQERGNALFKVVAGTSKYPLVNPQLSPESYLAIQAENGDISTIGIGAKNIDDTLILRQGMLYCVDINATLRINCKMTLRTPLDEHTYIRVPVDFTAYNSNPRVYPITVRPQAGSVRDAGLCFESFKGLKGAEPEMCSGVVLTDVYITMNGEDGGEVKVGQCLIGGMFRTVITRPYASGFTRHNILLCRTWYSTYYGLFGRNGRGSGVTIGKHPDVNQAWDGAVNAVHIDEVWGHTNGQAGTWVADTNEDIGYGVGIYGEMFSVSIGKVIGELNKGSGFQNKMKYGNLLIHSMYLEANTGIDYYGASTNSSGISWRTPSVFLSQRGKVKVKPDNNTTASLIGFPFVINESNVFDFEGVSPSRVSLSRESNYYVRKAIGSKLSNDFSVVCTVAGNLNTWNNSSIIGMNSVRSLEFDNNMELVFVPSVSTTSTDTFQFKIVKDGVDLGGTRSYAGEFTANKEVILAKWSGSYSSMYRMVQTKEYAQSCAGTFIIRSRFL